MSHHHYHDDRQLCMAFAMPDIDEQRLYYREYWAQAVARVGAASIKDAICQTYRDTGSVAKTANTLAFCETTIRNKLHTLGEPLKKPGGNNNPWGRKGKPRAKSDLFRVR